MRNKKICPDESIMKFLCNVYFGTEENIVRASRRAYLDFNRTIAFNDDYKEIEKDDKQIKKNKETERNKLFNKVTAEIKNFIENELREIKIKKDFDAKHQKLCENICKIYKGATCKSHKDRNPNDDGLYYGQAQKWVNMTLKYLYVLDKCEGGKKYDDVIWFFHVPIDNIILDMCAQPQKHELHDDFEKIKRSSTAWSAWNYNKYEAYREKLEKQIKTHYGENKAPLLWELENWTPKKNT